MLFNPKQASFAGSRLDLLAKRLRNAPAMSTDLFSEIVADVCMLRSNMNSPEAARRVDQLAAAGAWCEAALALIEIELPAWKLRRAVYEDGEWHCSLSMQPNLPIEFDETTEASHEVLALAILSAFVEVRRQELTPPTTTRAVSTDAASSVATGYTVCCDNFA
ncbi:MAG: hypothetical protein ACXWKA_20110 [Xanthobacteraceae bacterium]